MAVTRELEIVRVDLNDEYGASLWVRKKLTELSPEEAEAVAEDLMRVAAQGRALRAEDEAPMLEELRARLSEGTLTVDAARAAAGFPDPHTCRVCGCTTEDCSGCIARTGGPCWWVEVDLCSACAPAEFGEKRAEPKTATHGVFTLTITDDQPIPEGKTTAPNVRATVTRGDVVEAEFLYPAYKQYTLLAHWTDSLPASPESGDKR